MEHAVRPLCGDLRGSAGARRRARAGAAGGLLWPRAARPRHPRCAGARAGPLLRRHDPPQRAGHRRDRPDAGSGRLRPAAVPRWPAAGTRHRRAPHRRAGRSDRRRRPGAGRARRRRPAGDAGGGGPPLSRPLLQAQGRRQHRGGSRAAHEHRRRARPRRRRLPGDAGRQRAIRRRGGHRRAVAAHARDAGAGAPGRGHAVHRAADQARFRAAEAGDRARPPEAAHHRRVRTASWAPSRRRCGSGTAASPARTARGSTNPSSTPPASPSSTRRPARASISCRRRTSPRSPG